MSRKIKKQATYPKNQPIQAEADGYFVYFMLMNTLCLPAVFLIVWPLLGWLYFGAVDLLFISLLLIGVLVLSTVLGILPASLASIYFTKYSKHQSHISCYVFLIALASYAVQIMLPILFLFGWKYRSFFDGMWVLLAFVLMALPTCLTVAVLDKRNCHFLQNKAEETLEESEILEVNGK